MTIIQESWKAVAAVVITSLITFLTSTGGGISVGEAARSGALSLLTGLAIWLVPNQKPPVSTPGFVQGEGGQGIIGLVCTILGVIMIIIGAFHLIAAALNNTTPNWLLDIILIVVGLILVGVRYSSFGRNRGNNIY